MVLKLKSLNKLPNDISPVDSFDSHRVNGFKTKVVILPAPEC